MEADLHSLQLINTSAKLPLENPAYDELARRYQEKFFQSYTVPASYFSSYRIRIPKYNSVQLKNVQKLKLLKQNDLNINPESNVIHDELIQKPQNAEKDADKFVFIDRDEWRIEYGDYVPVIEKFVGLLPPDQDAVKTRNKASVLLYLLFTFLISLIILSSFANKSLWN